MKKAILFMLMCGALTCFGQVKEPEVTKVFFANSIMPERYFYSDVAYSAPAWVFSKHGKLPVSGKCFTPGNSLMLKYRSHPKGSWNVKVYYHYLRGIDYLKPATKLVMRVMIEGSDKGDFLPLIGLSDKGETASKFVSMSNFTSDPDPSGWRTVVVPLSELTSGDIKTLNELTFQNNPLDDSSKEHTLYLDQIEFSDDTPASPVQKMPTLTTARGYERHIDLTWPQVVDPAVRYVKVYRSSDNSRFIPVGIQIPQINRYADYVDTVGRQFWYKVTFLSNDYKESEFSNTISATTKALSDDELLDMVQEANFRYYWEGAEPNSGLARENIPGRVNMIASGASGFGIMALIAGTERKFISRDEAVQRFTKIVTFLQKAERFHGAYSHFIDGPTGKVEPFFGPRDNGGDLVETSFLIQGLLAAKQYFNGPSAEEKKIRNGIESIWKKVEWSWYRRTKDNPFLLWHWSPDKDWIINHKLIGWNETMITYILAICSPTHGVPASMYYTGWASQSEEARQYRSNWGKTDDGSTYKNGNTYFGVPLPVGVSNGGPLFFVHYSYLGLDPHQVKDAYTDYFTNNRNIALINYRYCVENLEKHLGYGEDCWGLTASDGPWGYSANEPVAHQDQGKMTPTGALASFPYTPEQSMAALKNYYRNYGHFLWGEYGFRDAFNLDEHWCSEIFMGLNQAPIVVMIENERSGLLWKLFMENSDIQKGLEKIRQEKVR